MATTDEILQEMAEEASVPVLVIDNDLRTITIPDEVKILGVESDDDVRRLHFRMPKMCGEFDLSEFELRVNYMNAGNEPDLYEVKDAAVSGDVIEFSWLVGRTAAKFKGDVKFIVCAKLIKADGVVEKEFNTTTAKLPVLEGLETSEAVVQLHPDIIEAILLRLSKLETDGTGTVSPEAIAQAVADYFAENPQSGILDEDGAVKREHIADLAINNAKLNYEAVSNAKIMAGTIQKDRMAADAIQYLTGGPYVSVSYDGAARADIVQGKHVFALRLIDDSNRNLRTWLLNHSTYDGVYLHQGSDIEGPIKLLGRTDFVGGIHGGEQLVSMRMIADGVDITGTATDLAGVKTLAVYVTSTVNDEDGGAVLFSREKVLTFSGTSLTVENRWVYTGAESVSVERWPGCGLYSVFAANSLGYTTCKTLTPSMDSLDADAAVREVAFWVSGTRVTLQALRGMDGASYAGIIEVLDGASRIKAYLDTIHAPEGYALNTGDVLEAAFRITIGEDAAGRINEIPKELPNPQPLVINGESYDGSEAKTVTIEASEGGGGAAIDDTTASATTTYSSQKIEEELSAKKSIDYLSSTGSSESGAANRCALNYTDGTSDSFTVYNGEKGEPGDDYILTEADKQEIAGMIGGNATGGSGGMTATQLALLKTLGNYLVFSDAATGQALFDNLITELEKTVSGDDTGGEDEPDTPDEPETPTSYTVTNSLTNVSTNNNATSVDANAAYTATLTPDSGYSSIGSVTITMGGVNVTDTVYADGVVTIEAVTGDVVIMASGAASDNLITAEVLAQSGSGSLSDGTSANGTDMICTPLIAVEPSTIYKTNIGRNLSDGSTIWSQKIGEYDSEQQWIRAVQMSGNHDLETGGDYTTGENTHYIRAVISTKLLNPYFGKSGVIA